MALKLAVVAKGLRYWQLAEKANVMLSEEQHLTEQAVTRLVTRRKRPSAQQAEAIGRVLGVPVNSLFLELGTNSEGNNRCCKCGQFCGDQWGATDSERMSKRADYLLCERCTRKGLLPDEGGRL
jgi:transcriptional regulator with XRE-family HTH domain